MRVKPNRRATLVDEISERTRITDAIIAELVDMFYGRVRLDPLPAPVFARVTHWEEHAAVRTASPQAICPRMRPPAVMPVATMTATRRRTSLCVSPTIAIMGVPA
jgi:hypothetical protein